jgi:flagellar biosynthesis/type III secretory pathway chaperone
MTMTHRPPTPTRSLTPPRGTMRAAPAQAAAPQRPSPGAPARATPAAANAGRSDDMMAVIRQLSEVLTKENLALKRHKTEEVKSLGERKEQLARLYQSHMNAIHRDPAAVKAWEPAKRNALAQAAIRLSELMAENASLLKANITSIDRFLKSVVNAVKERQEKQSAAYTKQGALNGYAAVKRNLAVSFNQTM